MRLLSATCVVLALVAGPAVAQEGFPLDGTWRGERRAEGQAPATVVVVMQWDGQAVTGLINPGPRAATLSESRLEPKGWKVRFAGRNKAGELLQFEGQITRLGEYHRQLVGRWTEAGRQFDLTLVRE
jgi:hypothetical protein